MDSKKEEESKKVQGVITNVEDVPDIQKRSPAATVSGKPKREGRYQVTLHRDVFGEKPIIKS